jgi:malonyl-CoA O-methyltransferase
MVVKERVIECFNSKAYSYDHAADIQPLVARQLAENLSSIKAETILEIGCGTGLFSHYLACSFPQSEILLTDIAPSMVAICQKRFSVFPNISVQCMDGEALLVNKQFDLIVSSMTAHWFVDIKTSLHNIINKLSPGGKFLFTMLGKYSLQEWSQVCHKHGVAVASPVFPDHLELQKFIPDIKLEVDLINQYYPSSYEFLKTLKSIGANAARLNHIPLSSGKLRRIMRALDNYSAQDMNISYEIIYGSYTKK